MFDTSSLVIFITATLAFLITPGPVVLYVIGRSVRQGRMAGFVSILGIHLASIVQVIFTALGLSAVLMNSALVYNMIKFIGAAYLVYLGVRTLTSKAQAVDIQNTHEMSYVKIFSQGFMVNILNPKTALFFLSFLPQFVDPSLFSLSDSFPLMDLSLISGLLSHWFGLPVRVPPRLIEKKLKI